MSNKNFWFMTTFNGKRTLKMRCFRTEKAAHRYANKMGYKYGELCNVLEEVYTPDMQLVRKCTWSA